MKFKKNGDKRYTTEVSGFVIKVRKHSSQSGVWIAEATIDGIYREFRSTSRKTACEAIVNLFIK